MGLPHRYAPRNDRRKDKRYKIIIKKKTKKYKKMDSRLRGNDISGMRWDCHAPKAVLAMTEKDDGIAASLRSSQ